MAFLKGCAAAQRTQQVALVIGVRAGGKLRAGAQHCAGSREPMPEGRLCGESRCTAKKYGQQDTIERDLEELESSPLSEVEAGVGGFPETPSQRAGTHDTPGDACKRFV